MTPLFKPAVAVLLLFSVGSANLSQKEAAPSHSPLIACYPPAPKIQAAILLDVSNSMDGLIEQAKAQLWNMVSVMGKAKCNGAAPPVEIALYEYGSPRNEAAKGYVKQLSAFTADLDGLSKNLFSLKTNGGDEYCGQVIYTAVNELAWDTSAASYKVIFIAGNEDFLQGSLHYAKACTAAKDKGILVNTLYCGDRMQGIREHWNLGGECGGEYTNINQDAREEEIPTPYDSSLMVLNTRLNGTYIGYGSQGLAGSSAQVSADKMNYNAAKPRAMLSRIGVKGNAKLYKNAGWDLVDAAAEKDGDGALDKLDKKTLPDSLQKLTTPQLKEYVKKKSAERTAVQTEITNTAAQREKYLAEERKRRAVNNNQQTLETERLIKAQAKKFNMVIE